MENAAVEIGHYRLLSTLGMGAFGKVKRKYDQEQRCLYPIVLGRNPGRTACLPGLEPGEWCFCFYIVL